MSDKVLNDAQLQAVTHGDGPLLIIAGAGTGKTTVITERIKHLILEEGVKPENILALTFTEKAAKEMETRVDEALPMGYTQTWILTFHGFCERILRAECIQIGLDPGFTLLSEAEAQLFIKDHLFEFDLNYYRPQGNPTKFIGGLVIHFSRLKDEDVLPNQYFEWVKQSEFDEETSNSKRQEGEISKYLELTKAYEKYEQLKIKHSVMDFSDLISNTLRLFRERANVLAEYQDRFPYVLIDEFQDTNYAQNQLAIMLAGKKQNITAVADDDQAIYRWRGAAVYNVMNFSNTFSNCTMVTLTDNYRSQQKILDLAHTFIEHNDPDRLEVQANINKKLVSRTTHKTSQIKLIFENTVEDEADQVARTITALNPKLYSDIAILIRANAHAEPFTRALGRHGIPFQFLGPGRLYKQAEIKDLIAYLQILTNFDNNHALYRVLSMPLLNIPGRDVAWLVTESSKKNIPLLRVLEKLVANPTEYDHGIEENVLSQLAKLVTMMHHHLDRVATSSPGEILYHFLADTGELIAMREPQNDHEVKKVENISAFFNKIKEYEVQHPEAKLNDFVNYLEFLIAANESPVASQTDWSSENAVNILTVHSSKGLEFETVFVVNLVDLRFPSTNRKDQIPLPDELIKEPVPNIDPHISEERRLFYVAMTRAKSNLFLTAAKFYHDSPNARPKKISPFVMEAFGNDLEKFTIKNPASETQTNGFEGFAQSPPQVQSLPFLEKPKITYLSYSQIESFDACPLHFKLDYILKIPKLSTGALSFGTAVHGTLKDVYTLIQRGELEKDLTKVYEKALGFYEAHWSPIGFTSKDHEASRYEDGKRFIRTFLESDLARVFTITNLEESFTFNVAPNLKVGGRIDRIDELPGGKVEIVDYKTGTKPDEKDLQKGIKGLQISIYALAAMQILDKQLEDLVLSFYYLESGERVSVTRTFDDLNDAKILIIDYRDRIEKSDFLCSRSYLCQQGCEYRLFCD